MIEDGSIELPVEKAAAVDARRKKRSKRSLRDVFMVDEMMLVNL